MFPYAYYQPSILKQITDHSSISGLVLRQFLCPKSAMVLRFVGMPRATMPEAPIHKKSDSSGRKREIRFAKYVEVSAPASNSSLSKNRGEDNLRFLVPATSNAGHHFRSFLFREHIHINRDLRILRARTTLTSLRSLFETDSAASQFSWKKRALI